MLRTFTTILLLFMSIAAFAQTAEQKAIKLTKEAIQLMDNGETGKSISLLEEAVQLDPGKQIYLYEIGYAYSLKKDFKQAIFYLEKAVACEDVTDQCYQMLGNMHDLGGNPEEAIATYKHGLERFPNSGRLHLELGVMMLMAENYNEAINYWEDGIRAEPAYSSTYYNLAKLFAQTNERMYAIFYGELFMNLERNTARTQEISALLYNAYRQSMDFSKKKKGNVSFVKTTIFGVVEGDSVRLPMSMHYELGMLQAGSTVAASKKKLKSIELDDLVAIRSNFKSFWNERNLHKKYPNVLLDFHQELQKRGFMEAYSYWVLMKGDQEAFDKWAEDKADEFDAFAIWFNKNPLEVTPENYFVRRVR